MMIQMEMGAEYEQTRRELGELGGQLDAAVDAGLEVGGHIAAGNVQQNYLSGQSLKSRTGMLRKEVTSWMAGHHEVVIGIPDGSLVDKYAYLLGDEDVTITPKNAKFLTIPIGEGLTGSGVPRYKSPREVKDGFFIKSKSGQLLFGYKRGKRGKFRALFVLVKSVLVQGTGALYDGTMDSMDDITGSIEDKIGQIKGVN